MEYWTIIDDRHAGPFTAEQLVANGVGLDTPVWISGLPDWVEAREIQELRMLIEARAAATQEAEKEAEIPEQKQEIPEQKQEIPEQKQEIPEQKQEIPKQKQEIPDQMPAHSEQEPKNPPSPPQGYYPPEGAAVPPSGYYPQGAPRQPWQPTPPRQQRPMQPQQGAMPQPSNAPYAPQPQRQPQPQWDWQREAMPIPAGSKVPPAYLAWAIISTVLCCIPLGVPAIVFSTKTKQAIKQGDLEKAHKMSERTQWFIILAIVLGLVSMPLQVLFSGFQ